MKPCAFILSILLAILTLVSSAATAQKYPSYVDTAAGPSAKPIIDTGMLGTWPSLGNLPPLITSNGNYLAFIINRLPFPHNTLVVRAATNTWKKAFVTNQVAEYFFSRDNKKLYWISADTFFSLVLGQEKPDYIADLTSFQSPMRKKGEWIAYRQDTAGPLILHNLVTGKKLSYGAVTDHRFSDQGDMLLIRCTEQTATTVKASLQLLDLAGGITATIWSGTLGQVAGNYSFDEKNGQLAFLVQDPETGAASLWYYKRGMQKAVVKVRSPSEALDAGAVVSGTPAFSANDKWLFFSCRQQVKKAVPQQGAVKVSIWSYKDKILYPQQPLEPAVETQGIVSLADGGLYVCGEGEQMEIGTETMTGDHIVVSDQGGTPQWWPHTPHRSYWLVSPGNKTRSLLKKEGKMPLWGFSFSPGGKWLVYWDPEEEAYISCDTRSGQKRVISRAIPPVSREPDYMESFYYSTYPQPVDQIAGWYEKGDALLVYDRYDVWKLDPAGRRPALNVTNGYGARHHTKLRLVYKIDHAVYSGNESVLLTAFNTLDKQNGFLVKKKLDQKSDPAVLTMGPYIYYMAESQKPKFYSFGDGMRPVTGGKGNNRRWIVQRTSATEAPNYYLSDDLVHYRPLTDLQPQKDYNWLTAELITWKQLDGSLSQGVLYKPENFDPRKRYPVVFNYYEMLSHRLNGFPWPGLTGSNINIPWFVSRGYLVFTPDIHFSVAAGKDGMTVGEAAYNAIESAAQQLAKLPYVDSLKMGLQGHSFGGGITNDLVTRSHRFAAACSVAGTVSNEISAYLGLVRSARLPLREFRMGHAENGHDRIGATLWQRPDLYIRASPVFRADRVTTPLLIMHNIDDGACDWGQSAELYMALRRLGKRVWLLQYEDEGHSLTRKQNALDFTIRLTQFFDHYLRDAAPPLWLTEGISPALKGKVTGYEPDISGRKP